MDRRPVGAPDQGERLVGLGVERREGVRRSLSGGVPHSPRCRSGELLFAATCDEETGGHGLEELAPKLSFDAAIVGEPTVPARRRPEGLLKLQADGAGPRGTCRPAASRRQRDLARGARTFWRSKICRRHGGSVPRASHGGGDRGPRAASDRTSFRTSARSRSTPGRSGAFDNDAMLGRDPGRGRCRRGGAFGASEDRSRRRLLEDRAGRVGRRRGRVHHRFSERLGSRAPRRQSPPWSSAPASPGQSHAAGRVDRGRRRVWPRRTSIAARSRRYFA